MTDQPIRIYKYLTAEHALRCLETAELKVSTMDTTNDPFDLLPCFTVSDPSDPAKSEVAKVSMDSWRETMSQHGIICMSGRADDPAVWSHYADAHRGIVIEFSHPNDETLFKVCYSAERMSVHADEIVKDYVTYEAFVKEAIKRKALSWQYEQEYRMFVKLCDCVARDGLYFYPISDDVTRRVILGAKCTVTEADVRRVLAQRNWRSVDVTRARLSKEHFRVEV